MAATPNPGRRNLSVPPGGKAMRRPSFTIRSFLHLNRGVAETQRELMSKETKLRFDLWHLLALISRRSKADPTSRERERPEGDESVAEILEQTSASLRFKEATAHHLMLR